MPLRTQVAPFVAVLNLALARIEENKGNQPKDRTMPRISDLAPQARDPIAHLGRNHGPNLGRTEVEVRHATLLVVEDSLYSCEVLRQYCRRLGIRLRRAADLGQARAHLRLYRPDIVMVDLGLPDGRGEGLIAKMAIGAHRPQLIIATSGDDSARATALAAGADLFLDKPLPDLLDFRRLLVDHFPRPLPLTHLPNRPFRPEADVFALHDDLSMADQHLMHGHDLPYISGFVAGVACSAGDQELHGIARADPTDFRQLRDIIQDRLRKMGGPL